MPLSASCLQSPPVLFPEKLLPGDGGICIHRWRPGTLAPLCCRPKRLFVQDRALAFVAASHLNDKDALVGSAGWHRALRCWAPPAGCGGPRGQRFLCVPTPGSGEAGGAAVCYEFVLPPCLPGAEFQSRSQPMPGEQAPACWFWGACPACRKVGISCCCPCQMPTCSCTSRSSRPPAPGSASNAPKLLHLSNWGWARRT